MGDADVVGRDAGIQAEAMSETFPVYAAMKDALRDAKAHILRDWTTSRGSVYGSSLCGTLWARRWNVVEDTGAERTCRLCERLWGKR